ncbi:hypothetical protein EBR04_03090 [bacterium]|nr:hypothetical protein [bacterium]
MCGLALPSIRAGEPLLQTGLRLPGEAGTLEVPDAAPRFVQPLEAPDTSHGEIPPRVTTGLGQRDGVGDSWRWMGDLPNGLRDPTESERDFAALARWRRGFVLMAVILAACAAVACLAWLLAGAQRR